MGGIMRILIPIARALPLVIALPGCAWGPVQTGAPHLDRALAAIHQAGYNDRPAPVQAQPRLGTGRRPY